MKKIVSYMIYGVGALTILVIACSFAMTLYGSGNGGQNEKDL